MHHLVNPLQDQLFELRWMIREQILAVKWHSFLYEFVVIWELLAQVQPFFEVYLATRQLIANWKVPTPRLPTVFHVVLHFFFER